MLKVLFIPFSVLGGYAAGFIGKALYGRVWGAIDEEEPPDPKHRDVTWPKLLISSALEGAIFTLSRAVFERATRAGFYNVTGSWPGDRKPDPR